VEGTLLFADASPAAGKTVFVNCQDDLIVASDVTDSEGRFRVPTAYSSADTILYPLPPRGPDGGFDLACNANSRVRPDVVVRQFFMVKFAPEQQAVIATPIELREPS
jgi:hypothetical protein